MTPEELARLAQLAAQAQMTHGTTDLAELAQRARSQDNAALVPHLSDPKDFVFDPATGGMVDPRWPSNPHVREGRGTAAAQGFGQGATFGWADEGIGALQAMQDGEGTYDQRRAFWTAMQREELRRARENHPVVAYGSELGGGIGASAIPAGAAARVTQGAGRAARVGTGIALGAAEGTVYGAGAAEEGERVRGAAIGSAVGASIGAAAPLAVGAASRVTRPVTNAVAARLGIGNQNRASRAVARSMDSAGVQPDDIRSYLESAARDGQPEFTIADAMGHEGQRALSGIARRPGPGRQLAVEALDARQAGQAERMGSFVDDALGEPRTAIQMTDALEADRTADAGRNYGMARSDAQPVDVRNALKYVDSRMSPFEEAGIAPGPSQAALRQWRERLGNADGSVTLSDFGQLVQLKSDLRSQIETLRRSGDRSTAASLEGLLRELDGSLEASSPAYRRANDQFAARSREIDAVSAGQEAARPRSRPADTIDRYRNLPGAAQENLPAIPGQYSPDPRAAFRGGYANEVQGRIEAAPPTTNAARPFTSPKRQAEMGEMAADPAQWGRRLDREMTMFETRRQATGGSATAQNLADNIEADAAELGPLVQNARDVGNLQFGSVLARGVEALAGENDMTKQMIARMLLANDAAALSPVQKSMNSSMMRRALMQAAIRQGNRPATNSLR